MRDGGATAHKVRDFVEYWSRIADHFRPWSKEGLP